MDKKMRITGVKMTKKDRIEWKVAKDLADRVCKELEPWCERIVVAGSIRRMKPIVGDIDLIAKTKQEYTREFVMQKFCVLGEQIIMSGIVKSSIVKEGKQIDLNLLLSNNNCSGAFILHHTGGWISNMKLRQVAKNKGLMLSQYGVFKVSPDGTQEFIAGETEESVYKVLGLPYVIPERRE